MQNFSQSTDEKIIFLFQKGNLDAVDFILSKYKTMVTSVARRYYLIGAEQEDLIQEGMIGLYKACLSFSETNASFKTFAYLCVKRQILSAVKMYNTQKNLLLNNAISLNSQYGLTISNNAEENEDYGETFIYLPSTDQTPENKIIQQENLKETVEQIKNALSVYEFDVLKEYLKGYKSEQIAKNLNKDFKSVDNALTRLKTKLNFLKI